MDDALEAWFCREILVHEAPLMRLLTRRVGKTLAEDLRHDVYIRILESAETHRPNTPKAFLFTTARNLLIDRARREAVVSIEMVEDLDALNVLIDSATPERHLSARQQVQRLSRILQRMPEKAREVLWMRRIEGLPQREVAQRLAITEAAVEKHVHRGLRLLAAALYGQSHLEEPSNQDATDEQAPRSKSHEPTSGESESNDGD